MGEGGRFRWALHAGDRRELLHDEPDLTGTDGRVFLFRFHPDTWTEEELQDDHRPHWSTDPWADCLCLEDGRVTYLRERGDDGVILSAAVSPEEARALARRFILEGRLPPAPEGLWWRDQDHEQVDLRALWQEQEQAWAEQRRRFVAELSLLNDRAATYADEFAAGRRVCPLCKGKGSVRFHDGTPLRYSSFSCDGCSRPFAVEDVDRTPQSRVE